MDRKSKNMRKIHIVEELAADVISSSIDDVALQKPRESDASVQALTNEASALFSDLDLEEAEPFSIAKGASTDSGRKHGVAAPNCKVIIKPENAFSVRVARSAKEGDSDSVNLVLVLPTLSLSSVKEIISSPNVAGVIVDSPNYPDHAKKMLQEAQKVLIVSPGASQTLEGNERIQIDKFGVVRLNKLNTPVTAICSHYTRRNVDLYLNWGIDKIGYFRFKFGLFELLSENPAAYEDLGTIEKFLTERLAEVLDFGFTMVRVVLSDPTSEELSDVGIRTRHETNPDLGIRGPRDPERWWPELKAIKNIIQQFPTAHLQISIPFVSRIEEISTVRSMLATLGINDKVELGFTLEVPNMVFQLPYVLQKIKPAFVSVGTSDLFSLLNAADRNNSSIKSNNLTRGNLIALEAIADASNKYGTHFFICGDIRKDFEMARRLVKMGVGEMISSSSSKEISLMHRAIAESSN